MSQPADNAAQAKLSRLSEAVREARTAAAERDDVVVEMREAQRTRLELLADELQPVASDVPDGMDGFDFALSSGEQPRLWIDAVAHVSMGRDRRTYRFLRDTRYGRVVLAETTDMTMVAEQVTRYVAERIVEWQRARDGEFETAVYKQPSEETGAAKPGRVADFLSSVALMLVGILVGAAVTLAVLRDRVPELQNLF